MPPFDPLRTSPESDWLHVSGRGGRLAEVSDRRWASRECRDWHVSQPAILDWLVSANLVCARCGSHRQCRTSEATVPQCRVGGRSIDLKLLRLHLAFPPSTAAPVLLHRAPRLYRLSGPDDAHGSDPGSPPGGDTWHQVEEEACLAKVAFPPRLCENAGASLQPKKTTRIPSQLRARQSAKIGIFVQQLDAI